MDTDRKRQNGFRKKDESKRVATADISIFSLCLSLLVYVRVLLSRGSIKSEYRKREAEWQ